MTISSNAQVKAALKKYAGVLSLAADHLGMTRQALWNRVNRSPDLQAFKLEIEERLVDVAEAVIADALMAKDKATTRWYLERKGRSRGYVTKTELVGGDGAPLQIAPTTINVTYIGAPPEPKAEEEVI